METTSCYYCNAFKIKNLAVNIGIKISLPCRTPDLKKKNLYRGSLRGTAGPMMQSMEL